MRAGLEEVDAGRLPGRAVGREGKEDSTVYLRALFKYIARGEKSRSQNKQRSRPAVFAPAEKNLKAI